jgi:signal transduction histidine kinase
VIPLADRVGTLPPRVRDVLAALVYLVIGLLLAWILPEVRITWWTADPPVAAGLGALLVACAALTQRRRRPVLALAGGVAAVAAGPLLIGATGLGVLLVLGDLLYCAVLYAPARASWTVAGLSLLTLAGITLVRLIDSGGREALLDLLSVSLLLAVPVFWALEVRRHRDLAEQARLRAEQERRIAEREREAALAAERTRMARDLHDVVAGRLSAIALQSEAALTLPDPDRAAMRRVLGAVREQSVSSLTEMRSMIGLLRSGSDEPRTAPDGLDRLDPLLASARATGLTVEVVDSRHGPLPADVELVAYRVVQEGLTNAAKHAPGSAVRVEIAERQGTLTVELGNPLACGRAVLPGAGTGLLGLRERAEALGGTVEAGRQGDGWRLRVALPLGDTGGRRVITP